MTQTGTDYPTPKILRPSAEGLQNDTGATDC